MALDKLLNEKLLVARDAARAAGTYLRAKLGTDIGVRSKDSRTNLVTEVDTESEALIRRLIAREFPQDGFVGEESGASAPVAQERWIVDPLDGTLNYTHGYHCFCVSIAFEQSAVVQLGVVYDPMAEEEYCAVRGQSATCNGERIRVSNVVELRDALLFTGFPPKKTLDDRGNLPAFRDFTLRAQAVRRDGSAALDLCYVASGRADGFWEPGLHAWDVAAGMLLVTEAGGSVTDYCGDPATLDGGNLVASNAKIHSSMLDILRRYA